MRISRGRELPPDLARVYRTAVRIEWLTIAYMLSAVALLYLTLGSGGPPWRWPAGSWTPTTRPRSPVTVAC
jgi:hypothetical protein